MRLIVVLGALGLILSACASVKHPARSICKDSCLKVEPQAQADCLARCE